MTTWITRLVAVIAVAAISCAVVLPALCGNLLPAALFAVVALVCLTLS